jgi:hypothetical protein
MTQQIPDRMAELLAGEAAGELDPPERAELDHGASIGAGQEEFMRAAALAQLAFMRTDRYRPAGPTEALKTRLQAQAANWNRRSPS